jgi:hypothetical protein
MTSTIFTARGTTFQRVVRHQRTFKGVQVGTIRDMGWLVMVRCDGDLWTPIHVIRKLKIEE